MPRARVHLPALLLAAFALSLLLASCGARTPLALGAPEDASLDATPPSTDAPSSAAGPSAVVASTVDPKGPCYMNNTIGPPDEVFILVSSRALTCAFELPSELVDGCPGDFEWAACIPIKTASLAVGTLDFSSVEVGEPYVYSGGGCPEGECDRGGNVFVGGTIAIAAIDASTVTFTLSGTMGFGTCGTVMADGTYTAPRCP